MNSRTHSGRISHATLAYKASEKCISTARLVALPEADRLVNLRNQFPRPQELGSQTPFEKAGQRVRRAIWRLNVSLGRLAGLGLDEIAEDLRDVSGNVGLTQGEQAANKVREAAEQLFALGGLNLDPLGDAISAALSESSSEELTLVVPSEEALDRAVAWMKAEGMAGSVHERRKMAFLDVVSHLIVLGAPRWYPPASVTAPRAEVVEFVYYDWLGPPPEMPGILPTESVGVERPIRTSSTRDSKTVVDPEDLPPSPNWSAVATQGFQSAEQADDQMVEARPVLLSGGFAALIRSGEGSEALCALPTDEGIELGRVSVDALEEGMYLIFRTSGSGSDFIKELADNRFGAKDKRNLLDVWKTVLRERISELGSRRVREELRARGARTANVGYWASADSIRPRSHRDFRVLLEYLGFTDDGPALMEAADQVFGAHIEAGHHIRGLLEEKIERSELAESGSVLRIELELGDGGELSVFRVMRASDERFLVPESSVQQPFPIEEATWLV